ncbi:MAG: hypothetical protein J0M04_12920 [Verrucomicrobia bacterium]|nr:hypothetical protein [Verrucomicrobiota bacterium]
MKTPFLMLLLQIAMNQSGFADTHARFVLAKVVDRETKAPIEGASLSTEYNLDKSNSEAKPQISTATTNKLGQAVLTVYIIDINNPKVDSEKFDEPHYRLELRNEDYRENSSLWSTLADKLIKRKADFIPDEPDVVFRVESEKTRERTRRERIQQAARDELLADKIVKEKPEYWPEAGDGLDEVGRLVIAKRWEQAKASGTERAKDKDEVGRVVKSHMRHENSEIHSTKFLNANTAMVYASWYSGPLAAAGYTYVVVRRDDKWMVIRSYREWIS